MAEREWREKIRKAKGEIDQRYRRAKKLADKLSKSLWDWDVMDIVPLSACRLSYKLCMLPAEARHAVLHRVGSIQIYRAKSPIATIDELYVIPSHYSTKGIIVVAVEGVKRHHFGYGRDTILIVEIKPAK